MPETTLTITHPAGLHMRPAALFVQTAARFKSSVRVVNLDRPASPTVDAKSMIGVMQIAVSQGHRVHINVEGEDAEAAIAALQKLVESGFMVENLS